MKKILFVLGLVLLAGFIGYRLRGLQQRVAQPGAQRGDEAAPAEPHHDRPADGPAADGVVPSAKNPLIRALEHVVGTSPVLEQEQDALQEQLRAADDILTRAKRDNASAMRQANRQVRIRGRNSPNIVLIVADELSSGDLGCYGPTTIETPAIDQLAADGCRFTNFYAGGGEASGSQWSLLTGLQSTRAPSGEPFRLRPGNVTIAEILWQAGYATGLIGDGSLGGVLDPADPRQHGFDRWYGYRRREDATAYPEYLWDNATRLRVLANAAGEQGVRGDDLLTREVLASLERHRRGRPFFLCVVYPRPQTSGTESGRDASIVTRFDRNVGSIRQHLQRLGLERNTFLLLTGENGAPRTKNATELAGPAGLRGTRGELYEGAIRVPLIVCAPSHLRGGLTIDRLTGSWDLLPTFADLVGAWHRPRNIDGISLMPDLEGAQPQTHRYLAWGLAGGNQGQAVRFGDWKAVRPTSSADFELYDLATDPGETKNLASQHPEVIAQIQRFLADSG